MRAIIGVQFIIERLGPGTNTKHKTKVKALGQILFTHHHPNLFLFFLDIEYRIVSKTKSHCT